MTMTKKHENSSSDDKNVVAGHKHGRVPRATREQQILDIAEKQFIEMGYSDTTVESVRLTAGVSRPIIYEHFGSKDRLYLACVKRARKYYEESLLAVWKEPGNPQDKMIQGAEFYFGLVEENPKRWQVLFSGVAAPMFGELGDELTALQQGTIDRMSGLIMVQHPNADPEQVEIFSQAIFAVGDRLGRWWLSHPEVPKARLIKHHVGFISGGLAQLVSDV